MRSGRIVTAPDGARWKVGRRWPTRAVKLPWKRRGSYREAAEDAVDALGSPGLSAIDAVDSLPAGIAVAVLAVVVAVLLTFVILPLLGLAIEVALLIALFGSGLFARVVLRRPWTIEAVNLDGSERRSFAVKGWRRSRRAIDALASTIAATGLPSQLAEAETPKTAVAPSG